MKINISIIVGAIIFLGVAVSLAQNDQPQVPYIQHDICPFECCQYGKWVARSPLKAYIKEGDDSTIAYTIKSGEEFITTGGNVHVVKLGLVSINKTFDIFSKGDKVYVLSYRGEGTYDLWYKGKLLDLDLNNIDKIWENGQLIKLPQFVWWVSIKNKNGKQGWLKLKNISESGFSIKDKIEGMDSCS